MKADVLEKLAETRAQPGTTELGSPSSSEGLALQDQRAICDTHESHGRDRQLHTQMRDDKAVAGTWTGT